MNKGLVLKKLRQLKNEPLKAAAKRIGKSVGWLSEIENEKGNAVLTDEVFEELIKAYDGAEHRKRFHRWKEDPGKKPKRQVKYDGAVLRYLREKNKLSLEKAARIIGISKGHLSNIELSRKPMNKTIKERALKVYGCPLENFKNYTGNNNKRKGTPAKYKLQTLLISLSNQEISQVFEFASLLTEKRNTETEACLGGKYANNR